MKKITKVTTGTSIITRVSIILLFLFTPVLAEDFSSMVRVHSAAMSCSGTVIESENDKTLVLTCWHGTKTEHPISVSFYNKDGEYSFPAKLVKHHKIWDLALLEVKGKVGVEVSLIAGKTPEEYTQVSATGYHPWKKTYHFKEHTYYYTTVEKGMTTTDGELLFTANGKAVNGMSGSSFQHKKAIIAVMSSGTPYMMNGARLETIRKFLSP